MVFCDRRPFAGLYFQTAIYSSSIFRRPSLSLLCPEELLIFCCSMTGRPPTALLKSESFCSSSMARRISTCPLCATAFLWSDDLSQLFHDQTNFYKSSMPRRSATGLVCSEDLLQVPFAQKNSYRFIMTKRPSTDLLLPEYVVKVLHTQKTLYRSYTPRRLLQVFYTQKTFYGSSTSNRLQVFYGQKRF